MALIIDADTGLPRPYDPDKDFDKPASLFGALPPDPDTVKVAPLNPLRDLA